MPSKCVSAFFVMPLPLVDRAGIRPEIGHTGNGLVASFALSDSVKGFQLS